MNRNRRFAELAGIEWHERVHQERSKQVSNTWRCSCGRNFGCPHGLRVHIGQSNKSNPDFTADPTKVLVEMEKFLGKDRFQLFLDVIHGEGWLPKPRMIKVDLILDRTGKLCDLGIEWMEGRKK